MKSFNSSRVIFDRDHQKEVTMQFFHGWLLTAQCWLDEGRSREEITRDLVKNVGPKMARNILGAIK